MPTVPGSCIHNTVSIAPVTGFKPRSTEKFISVFRHEWERERERQRVWEYYCYYWSVSAKLAYGIYFVFKFKTKLMVFGTAKRGVSWWYHFQTDIFTGVFHSLDIILAFFFFFFSPPPIQCCYVKIYAMPEKVFAKWWCLSNIVLH